MAEQPLRVLVVEDEPRMRELIVDYFSAKETSAIGKENGVTALHYLRETEVDAVILDVMMPEKNGFSVCQALREDAEYRLNCQVPILFLSALSEEEELLTGYHLGADEYMTKPFSLAVLYAKTLALVKRVRSANLPAGNSRDGSRPILDFQHRTAIIDGVRQKLARKEFDLLRYLMENPDCLLTRDMLLAAVWGDDYTGEDRTVDNHIRKLRARGIKIETEYGIGYRYHGD